MIQIAGETTLLFKTDKISMNLVINRLNDAFTKYNILSHDIYKDNHKLHINFTMTTKENYKCKTIDDYIIYLLPELKTKFPLEVEFYFPIVHRITKEYQSIEPIKNHMVTYINN